MTHHEVKIGCAEWEKEKYSENPHFFKSKNPLVISPIIKTICVGCQKHLLICKYMGRGKKMEEKIAKKEMHISERSQADMEMSWVYKRKNTV